jgi:hypothetical protein
MGFESEEGEEKGRRGRKSYAKDAKNKYQNEFKKYPTLF